MLPYGRNLKNPSRELRGNMTNAEQLLWSRLRRKQILDVQFYRQKPIGPFIVDFYAPGAGLVIEVDGGQHYEEAHQRQDIARDKALATLGLLVLRFDNYQVLHKLDSVAEQIFWVVKNRVESRMEP